MISALPDVKRITLTPKDEFMILACDGIWNSLSSEEVVSYVRTRIQKGETKMSAICEEVSDYKCVFDLTHTIQSYSLQRLSFKCNINFFSVVHNVFGTEYMRRWNWM